MSSGKNIQRDSASSQYYPSQYKTSNRASLSSSYTNPSVLHKPSTSESRTQAMEKYKTGMYSSLPPSRYSTTTSDYGSSLRNTISTTSPVRTKNTSARQSPPSLPIALEPVVVDLKSDKSYENSCPICGQEFNEQKSFEDHITNLETTDCARQLATITGDLGYKEAKSIDTVPKEKKKEVDKEIPVALRYTSLSQHYRCDGDSASDRTYIPQVAIIASENSQFSYGGKNACTTIALEASINLMHETVELNEPREWTPKSIDDIVKTGCMQDLQRGNLSFQEVYESSKRFQDQLEIIDIIQGDTKHKDSFADIITRLINTSTKERQNLCAIITRQPETIVLFYLHLSPEKAQSYKDRGHRPPIYFVAFDSHVRRTDDRLHGAHVLYFTAKDDVHSYLTHWLFPPFHFKSEGDDELYNTYSCTIVGLKNKKYQPFILEKCDSKNKLTAPQNELEYRCRQLEKENASLQKYKIAYYDMKEKYLALQEENQKQSSNTTSSQELDRALETILLKSNELQKSVQNALQTRKPY